jgi:hypothetical protein
MASKTSQSEAYAIEFSQSIAFRLWLICSVGVSHLPLEAKLLIHTKLRREFAFFCLFGGLTGLARAIDALREDGDD